MGSGRTGQKGCFDSRHSLDSMKKGESRLRTTQSRLDRNGDGFRCGCDLQGARVGRLDTECSAHRYGKHQHTRAQNLKTKDNAKWTFDGFKQAYVASDKKNSQELGEEFDQMGEDLKDMLTSMLRTKRAAARIGHYAQSRC